MGQEMDHNNLKDLRWTSSRLFRIEVDRMKGFRISRNGRRVPITHGVEYVKTHVGEMTLESWYERMEDAVAKEGLSDFLQKIIEYCQRCAWIHSEEERRKYALECLSSEAYKAWDDFASI